MNNVQLFGKISLLILLSFISGIALLHSYFMLGAEVKDTVIKGYLYLALFATSTGFFLWIVKNDFAPAKVKSK